MRHYATRAAQSAPWTLPALVLVTAVCVLVAGLWLTNMPAETRSAALGEEQDNTKDIQLAVEELAYFNAGSRMVVEAFATQAAGPATNGTQATLIPEEWEQPLFDILLNEEITMDQRNASLIDLATGPAKGVPSVQEECLMHLVFGISDDNGAQFVAVATNPAIPIGMRAEFLKQALEMRPRELGEWLSQQVSNHYEPEITSIARLYLLELRKSERHDF